MNHIASKYWSMVILEVSDIWCWRSEMTVKDIIAECKELCAEYTKNFLLKNIRSQYYKTSPDTYNDVWIRNYCLQFVIDLLKHEEEYERIYVALGDTKSQETFREICIKRFLYTISMENRYCYLYYPTDNDFQTLLGKVDNTYLLSRGDVSGKTDEFLWKGYCIISETKNIAAFELEQYSYSDIVQIQNGYTVLDCGASQGEEILYFSSIAENLSFHSFTLDSQEIERYLENMKRNEIKGYQIHRNAVWSVSEENVSFIEEGSRSMVTPFGENQIRTITLNDYVKNNSYHGPFFIKMDIEGAEVDALLGSDDILSLPFTQAAISVYHKPNDLRKIGMILLQYRDTLYLKQCKSNLSETMMYIDTKKGD